MIFQNSISKAGASILTKAWMVPGIVSQGSRDSFDEGQPPFCILSKKE
jgi:hypothetical protein